MYFKAEFSKVKGSGKPGIEKGFQACLIGKKALPLRLFYVLYE